MKDMIVIDRFIFRIAEHVKMHFVWHTLEYQKVPCLLTKLRYDQT